MQSDEKPTVRGAALFQSEVRGFGPRLGTGEHAAARVLNLLRRGALRWTPQHAGLHQRHSRARRSDLGLQPAPGRGEFARGSTSAPPACVWPMPRDPRRGLSTPVSTLAPASCSETSRFPATKVSAVKLLIIIIIVC